jgi:hypothetical protein
MPMVFGVIGILVLVFALLVMYRMVRDEDIMNGPPPVDPNAAPLAVDELGPGTSATDHSPEEPAKAEKPPPLNER